MSDAARAAGELTRLIEIVAALRGPGGCPWDREQTIDSLKPFVLEETYEVIEAIDAHDHRALCEELGDFVFEAVFVAQLEEEAGLKARDIIRSVNRRMVKDTLALRSHVAESDIGARVELGVIRDGKEQTVTAVIAEAPAQVPKPAPQR